MLNQLDQPRLCRVAVRNLLGHLAQEGTERLISPPRVLLWPGSGSIAVIVFAASLTEILLWR